MKSFNRILLLVGSILILSVQSVIGSHFMGVDISYECIGPCTYRIYVTTYYDCTSTAITPTPVVNNAANAPAAPGTFDFDIFGTGTGCNDPVGVGGWQFVSYLEVTPVCPTATTECDGTPGQLRGVAEAVYYQDFDFCNTNCNEYIIEWDNCCRNAAINSGAANDGIYTGSTTINTAITPCNSSPQFSNPPIPYLCQGETFTFNQGAFDPDGDSLVYSLGPCSDGPGVNVGYGPGFSPTQPLGAGWNVTVNSFTGDITIAPTPPTNGPQVTAVMCIVVEEYRNGVKIGEVLRDMQITVIDCAAFGQVNESPTISNITTNSPGASVNGFTVDACACEEVCINIPSFDIDSAQTWKMYVFHQLPGGVFSNALNPGVPLDTIVSGVPPTGQFCWTPTQSGPFQLLVSIVDDGCPIIGINQYTIVFDVGSCPSSNTANASLVGCFDGLFTICGGPAPNTAYTWSGGGGLFGTGDSLIYTYPGPGTYNYNLAIFDSTTNQTLNASGSISMTNTSTADAGADISVCPSQTGTIGTAALPGYTYQWSSPGNQGFCGGTPTNIAQPCVSLNNGTSNPITIPFVVAATDPNGCVALDTTLVTFTPKPPSNFSIQQPVCINEVTSVVYASSQTLGVNFNWDYDGGNGSTTGPGPHQVSWTTPGIKFVRLWVDRNGCLSDTTVIPVTVNSIPTANFSLASPVCEGQPAQVLYTGTASGGATFVWDFDGGNGGGGAGPFGVTWPSPGVKDVSLTVIENGCVSPMITLSTTVNQIPTADFNLQTDVCLDDNIQITYTGNATANAGYTWNFDGGQVISGTGGGPFIVEWLTPGVKTVCLQVEENGCISNLNCQTINVLGLPNASIAPVSNQCFNGNSFTFLYNGPTNVTTYAWDFGPDAVPATSSSSTPSAVSYLNSGPKQVSLVVTRNGCVGDSAIINFEVVPDPSANFSFSTGVSCQNDGVTFQYTGTSVGPNQTYAWDFGMDAIPATSSQPNPGTIMYASGGTKTVSLVVGYRGCIATSVQQVTVNPGPIVNAGVDKEFCDGEGGVQVSASVSGGTAPYFFNWTCDDPGNCGISNAFAEDPTMNPNIGQATDTVVYYFQVTDVNGCVSNIDSVSVIVKAKPLADAGPDRDICAEGPGAFLNGGPAANNRAPLPFTYQWLPANGLNDGTVPNPFARPDTTTIYTLVVNSANGCTSDVTTLDTTSTVTVKVNALPIAEAGADTAICLNEFVQLQGSASEGGPDYTYAWTPATTGTIDDATLASPTVTPNFTTTFFLVVTSNGCDSYADSVEVIVDTKPTLSPGTDVSVCQGDSVQLDGAASGDPNGSNYRYQWSPAIGLSADDVAKPMAAPKQTTTYTVTATSEHGCGSDASQVLVTVESTPVVFLLSQDTVICEGSEITLSADHGFKTPPSNPVSYSWTPEASVTSSPYLNSVTVAPTSTTLYTVTASAPSGCATSEAILITVSPKVEATLSADTTQFCEGTSTQLYAAGGRGNASFAWIPGAGLSDSTIAEPVASPSVSTLYQVVISEGACSDTAQIELAINAAPVADYLASQVKGCEGLAVNFMENSTNGVNYLWDFGDGSEVINGQNPTYTYANAGSYPVTLKVIGAGGCEASITKAMVEISASGTADFSSDPNPGAEVALPNAGVSFSDLSINGMSWYWDFGDGTISTEQNPAHVYQSAGEYSVSLTVTDENGCVSEIQYGPYIIYSPELGVPNIITPNDDGVNDRFTIQYTGNESYNLEIFDRWGRSFFQSDAPQDAWEGTDMNGGKAIEGVYYYSLKIGDKIYNGNLTLLR